MEMEDDEDEVKNEWLVSTRTPMMFGGTDVPTRVTEMKPSIFRPKDAQGKPRVKMPTENPSYPDTKHTLKKTIHNIGVYPVTDRPGTESYDPVMLGGNSLVDHYPYASVVQKEVCVNPNAPQTS